MRPERRNLYDLIDAGYGAGFYHLKKGVKWKDHLTAEEQEYYDKLDSMSQLQINLCVDPLNALEIMMAQVPSFEQYKNRKKQSSFEKMIQFAKDKIRW